MDETPITIAEYNPEWPDIFERERQRLASVLDEYTARIEHIGSTSVPGLAAKPIIDITAVVTDIDGCWGDLDKLSAVFGYELSSIPSDWLFVQRTDESGQLYNLHLISAADDQWKQDLLFREYLRTYPDVRDEYASVKRSAAESNPNDITAYTYSKNEFCQSVLERARADDTIEVPGVIPEV
ncbi:GrpB family protein [Halogeometricum borinquense]|uniref:GrpB family protein n=1 Tax=Halogeometricum borinquense TaxID=60847 RepID=A0A482TD81_9EURY|nr:GrpB family protein [Halogeometricum borinquense]RYJ14256.1 GrpB family protein [Halogeometricum borinquense]